MVGTGALQRYARKIPYKDIEECTDYFCEENHIGDYEYGRLYRGEVMWSSCRRMPVTVKIWDVSRTDDNHRDSLLLIMMDEILLLQNEFIISHPTIPNVCGYFLEEEHMGVLYYFEPVDTVYNLLPKGEFSWLQRIKVADGIACLLNFFHDQEKYVLNEPFVVCNLDASRLMLDKEGNPKLCDLSMMTGGFFVDMGSQSRNIDDASTRSSYDPHGEWTEKTDVYAFGVLLLNLISKRVYTDEERSFVPSYYEWTQEEEKFDKADAGIKRLKCSLVHKSLEADPCFYIPDGPEITKLAIRCMEYHPGDRPTMKEVVDCLQKLEIVQRHSDLLCIISHESSAHPNLRVWPRTK